MKFSKNVNNKKHALNWYSSMKKKLRKIRIIFDIENWLWKSENVIFRSLDLERTLIWQNSFFMKKCYFSLNKATIWCGSCWKNLKCYLVHKGLYHLYFISQLLFFWIDDVLVQHLHSNLQIFFLIKGKFIH